MVCFDNRQNIILADTDEVRHLKEDRSDAGEHRFLGMVMVPGNHIVTCEVDQS